MTLQQLQYVVALDTHRHFVKAAESCFVAQPTLTLQVKKLEEQIDLLIFDRSVQPMKPTPMGQVFISKARQILRDVEQLKQLVSDEKSDMQGTFKIGIIPSLSQYLLPLFLADFSQQFPQTNLEIKEWQSDGIIEGLQNGLLDLGILVTPLEESSLREIPLFYEPFLVYANKHSELLKEQRVNLGDMDKDGLWLLEKGHCFRNQILNICANREGSKTQRNIHFEGGSLETLKRMIQKISGYTLIPELSFDPYPDGDFTRRFNEPEPAREVSIVVHKSFTKENLITSLRKSILKFTPESFRKNNRFVTVKWR